MVQDEEDKSGTGGAALSDVSGHEPTLAKVVLPNSEV